MIKKTTFIFLALCCAAQAMERKLLPPTLAEQRIAASEAIDSIQRELYTIKTQIKRRRQQELNHACYFGSLICYMASAWRWMHGLDPSFELALGTLNCGSALCLNCCDEKPNPALPTSLHDLRKLERHLQQQTAELADELQGIEAQNQRLVALQPENWR